MKRFNKIRKDGAVDRIVFGEWEDDLSVEWYLEYMSLHGNVCLVQGPENFAVTNQSDVLYAIQDHFSPMGYGMGDGEETWGIIIAALEAEGFTDVTGTPLVLWE